MVIYGKCKWKPNIFLAMTCFELIVFFRVCKWRARNLGFVGPTDTYPSWSWSTNLPWTRCSRVIPLILTILCGDAAGRHDFKTRYTVIHNRPGLCSTKDKTYWLTRTPQGLRRKWNMLYRNPHYMNLYQDYKRYHRHCKIKQYNKEPFWFSQMGTDQNSGPLKSSYQNSWCFCMCIPPKMLTWWLLMHMNKVVFIHYIPWYIPIIYPWYTHDIPSCCRIVCITSWRLLCAHLGNLR